jgi:hypothetical protein
MQTTNIILIGEGSGRKIYDLNNGLVLKQWYTEWGKQQNINEIKIYHSICDEYKKYLAPVESTENDNVLMEKIKPIDKETFEKEIKNKKFFIQLTQYLSNNHDLNNDIINYSSWGINKNGEYVLLDYGYTHKLYNEFMWEYTNDPKYLDPEYIEW